VPQWFRWLHRDEVDRSNVQRPPSGNPMSSFALSAMIICR